MFNKLKQWREDRKISGYNHKTQVSNIVEETLELMYMPKSKLIEKAKDEIVDKYFIDDTTNKEKIDAYCDLIVFSVNAIELLGYDAEKCMDETIKEISSRRQNPMQKEIWEKWGYDNTKWEKDKNQPKDTLYVANYESCKKC
jgi:hypothetical protein